MINSGKTSSYSYCDKPNDFRQIGGGGGGGGGDWVIQVKIYRVV